MVGASAPMVRKVRPEQRPDLAPASPSDGATIPRLEGGAAAILVPEAAPRSRIAPDVSTVPATIWAMAAPTFFGAGPPLTAGVSGANSDRWATVLMPGLQLLSTMPGWETLSP